MQAYSQRPEATSQRKPPRLAAALGMVRSTILVSFHRVRGARGRYNVLNSHPRPTTLAIIIRLVARRERLCRGCDATNEIEEPDLAYWVNASANSFAVGSPPGTRAGGVTHSRFAVIKTGFRGGVSGAQWPRYLSHVCTGAHLTFQAVREQRHVRRRALSFPDGKLNGCWHQERTATRTQPVSAPRRVSRSLATLPRRWRGMRLASHVGACDAGAVAKPTLSTCGDRVIVVRAMRAARIQAPRLA